MVLHPYTNDSSVEDGKWGKVTVSDLALAGIRGERIIQVHKNKALEEIMFEFITNFSYRINIDSTRILKSSCNAYYSISSECRQARLFEIYCMEP